MARVLDLYETQKILLDGTTKTNSTTGVEELITFDAKDFGIVLISSVSSQKANYVSYLRQPPELQTERKIKKKFQEKLRDDFYRLKNQVKIYNLSKTEALSRFNVDMNVLDSIQPNGRSIEGLVKQIIKEKGCEQSCEILGQALIKGSRHYHSERPDGIDGKYKLFLEYNYILNSLANVMRE